jgi:hypothetical protein
MQMIFPKWVYEAEIGLTRATLVRPGTRWYSGTDELEGKKSFDHRCVERDR